MQAVLCGYYGMGNGGDEALLCTLLKMLPSHVTPIVLSGNPEFTSATYGVTAYDRKNPTKVLTALRQADIFIWGGGSLMQDATSLLNPFYYGGLMFLAQALGLKTIAWGQGIGPLRRSPTRWLTRYCLRHCTAVSVRDERSFALVKDWNIPATLAPDPVWALSEEATDGHPDNHDKGELERVSPLTPNTSDNHDHSEECAKDHSNTVAVILRPHPLLTPSRLQAITQALITLQQTTGCHILLVPFQPVNDRPIATDIQAQLSGTSEIVENPDPRQLHRVFARVKFAIAMRLHGAIMAIATGCQCWALSYDPKVTQLMKDLDLPGWELDQLPDAHTMGQQWIQEYQQGRPMAQERLQALGDRARLHQALLHNALAPESSSE